MTAARALSLLAIALAVAGCSLTLDADDGNRCDAAGQCPGDLRCVHSRCIESGPVCGDFELDPGEECDGGDTVAGPCEYAQISCIVCDATCKWAAGATSYCGDGSTDSVNGETCDAGGANSNSPDADCRTDCKPKRCGDSVLDTGETCDRGSANVAACPPYDAFPPVEGYCSPTCLACPAPSHCGDGAVDAAGGETCDLGASNGRCGQPCSRDCAAWSCDREWVWWTPGPEAPPVALYDTGIAGIVVDGVSGLTWQGAQSTATHDWAGAKTYCAGLSLGGLTGWRLPTYNELLSIVDYSTNNPAINPIAFPGTTATDFWSSTPDANVATSGWVVDFWGGTGRSQDQGSALRVRCVR